MEILTYKKVYQLVGDSASGTNECITKSAAVEIAQAHRKKHYIQFVVVSKQ